MLRRTLFLFTPLLLAQVAPNGSIHGVVTDAATGAPVQHCQITVLHEHRQQTSPAVSSDGRYLIPNLPAGSYSLTARCADREPAISKSVQLAAGEDCTLNIRFQPPAVISGRVVDQNEKPATGVTVRLVRREYRWGALRYIPATSTTTDPEGRYTFSTGIVPGISYLLLAARPWQTDAVSKVPADPEQRPVSNAPTYYPNSIAPEDALPLVLAAAEVRDKVNIRLKASPCYCVTGTILIGGQPASSNFSISTPALAGSALRAEGKTGSDGKFRVCDLAPGQYVVNASLVTESALSAGSSEFVVDKGDVRDLEVLSANALGLRAEVTWDEAPSPAASKSHISISLAGLAAYGIGGAEFEFPSARIIFPGLSSRSELYGVRVALPSGLYAKQVTYAGVNVMNRPLPLVRGIDSTLKIVVARDGGALAVHVTNSDGEPVPDAVVFVIPGTATTLPEVSALLTTGQADQHGNYTPGTLAPGKYLVLASHHDISTAPEDLAKLCSALSKGSEVEVGAKSTVQVIVQPVSID